MSPERSITTGRAIVEDVLGRDGTRELWTGNYEKAIPISVQDFDLRALLPAVFYMFRFGQRRGKGKFLDTFGSDSGTLKERRRAANIDQIASKLAETNHFEGFAGKTEQAILGDLLLCFCLENVKRGLGRQEQVQRVAPAHYMASWIDLPDVVAHLRFVPEMIVAMLANQDGDYVQQYHDGDHPTWFPVGKGFEDNVLLKAFHAGIVRRGELGSRTADRFEEETDVGLDQLLMIRLAQQLGAAPDKLRGGEAERISNQRPIAEKASVEFSEDMRRFVRSFANIMPRHAFVELLESCMAVGMTTILLSVTEILFEWADTGSIRKKNCQEPSHLFVDCSNGVNRSIRALAEQSMGDLMRRLDRLPVILMALRIMDRGARYDSKIKALKVPTRPFATEWLNLLGDLLHDRSQDAKAIMYGLDQVAAQLAEKLEAEGYSECAQILKDEVGQPSPVWRIAESLTYLQGRGNAQSNLVKLLDAVLLMGRPNGLALKRTTTNNPVMPGARQRSDMRSLVLTDSVLDYLVHLHILPRGSCLSMRSLPLKDFIHTLRMRYGLCVDSAPPGMAISNDILQANRAILESRLRDLGLLVGVNDAEAMKRLRSRFDPAVED